LPSSTNLANKDISTEISTPSQNVEELQAKIDNLRDTIVNFSKMEKKTHTGVTQQLLGIIEDAKRLKIDREELRRMLNESFNAKGPRVAKASESYIRRLLPPEYKYPAKARLDYKTKQKVERKLHKFETDFFKEAVEIAREQSESEELQRLITENKQQKEAIQSLRNELDKLKEEGGGEVWTAIGILEMNGNQMPMPLKITVNTKRKKIERVEVDRVRGNEKSLARQ
jgi:predicted ribosome quality control (RQC) complex YloA/Tae2 family protein